MKLLTAIFACIMPLLWVGCVAQRQVQMEYLAPPQVEMPQGAQLVVQADARKGVERALEREFAAALKRTSQSADAKKAGDAAVRLVVDAVSIRCRINGKKEAVTQLGENELNTLHENRLKRAFSVPVYAELSARVSLLHGPKLLWSRTHTVTVPGAAYTRIGVQEPCRLFVKDMLPYIAPHPQTYTVHLKLAGAPPELEQAVHACKRKDWATALEHARLAHRKCPQAAEPVYLIGLLARHYGDYPASTALFKKAYALQTDPRYLTAQEENPELYRTEFKAHSQ